MMDRRYPDLEEGGKGICETGARLYQRGLIAAGDGNISVKCGDDRVLVTPSGVSKGFMTPDMLVLLDLSGKVLSAQEGWRPSSEIEMHLRVYQVAEQAGAVVHAHPVFATACGVAGVDLSQPILSEALMFLGPIAIAPYGKPGTRQVPDSIEPYIPAHRAILLAHHGALTWGKDLTEAWFRMESLEQTAKTYLCCQTLLRNRNMLTEEEAGELAAVRERLWE